MKDTTVNVLMLGGRLAGKTSALAVMDECCREKLASVPSLKIFGFDSYVELFNKRESLIGCFYRRYDTGDKRFIADTDSDNEQNTYTYDVEVDKLLSSHSGCTLNFINVPGAWLNVPEMYDKLERMINISQIIIIAIDTPRMVECIDEATGVGKYHQEFNNVPEIERILRYSLCFHESEQGKMILFVPLKCEKYYYRNKMNFVRETLKKGYGEIKELCTVGIVPILTIGGVEFFEFDDHNRAIYTYLEDESLRKFNPRYSEQLLLISLYFFIRKAERDMQKGRFMRCFVEPYWHRKAVRALIACGESILKLIERDETKGFSILQDPFHVF